MAAVIPDWEQISSPCVTHTHSFDVDCDFCAAELESLQRVLQKSMKNNQATEQRLAYVGVKIDLAQVLVIRINTLLDLLFAENPKARQRYEIIHSLTVEEVLANTETQANRARLLMPNQ